MRAIVFGAGGHAAVVIDALRGASVEVVGLLDDHSPEAGRTVLEVPVIGNSTMLSSLRESGVTHVHVAVGDSKARLRIAQMCEAAGLMLLTVVHASSTIGAQTRIGAGSFVAAQSIIGPRSGLGRCVIVNHASSVDHDCDLADGVHVAPGVRMGGHVTIGRASLIGIGSVLRDRIRVGELVTLGAGSVVVSDLPDRCVAFGVPARVVRSLDGLEAAQRTATE